MQRKLCCLLSKGNQPTNVDCWWFILMDLSLVQNTQSLSQCMCFFVIFSMAICRSSKTPEINTDVLNHQFQLPLFFYLLLFFILEITKQPRKKTLYMKEAKIKKKIKKKKMTRNTTTLNNRTKQEKRLHTHLMYIMK
jgi:hypothetical protein